MRIELGNIVINDIGNSSGVFYGDNIQCKWKAVIKSNSGFGTIEGDANKYFNNQSLAAKTELLDEVWEDME